MSRTCDLNLLLSIFENLGKVIRSSYEKVVSIQSGLVKNDYDKETNLIIDNNKNLLLRIEKYVKEKEITRYHFNFIKYAL